MYSSAEDALALLSKWHEEETWVLVVGHFNPRDERHSFWATCFEVSPEKLLLAGEFVSMQILLDSARFEYADTREMPEPAKSAYAGFECMLKVEKAEFSVILMASSSGSPVPILTPDIIQR